MSCTGEYTVLSYLQERKKIEDKIIALDSLIVLFMDSLEEHILGVGSSVSEYQLDDGQVKIRTSFRSIPDLMEGIKSLEKLKIFYENRLRGRVITLVDVTKFR